ncbi:unnamed protein product [Diatraea saccharalis]|uniref:PHD-type domain-containing protein n=1 Tax=Diatraea saccharalis TaxID=40085 RepID=A0A9N9R6G7_9NEOP|nr:unnamed protein product [Diatraea saccharalis]
MPSCGAFGKFLSALGAAICGQCTGKYHKACLGLSEKAKLSKNWTCPNCPNTTRKSDNTPVKGVIDQSDDDLSPAKVAPVADVLSVCQSSRAPDENDMLDWRRALAEWTDEMRKFRGEMVRLRESITSITARLDGTDRRLDDLTHRIEALESKTDSGRVPEMERVIESLKSELSERDRESLLADLDIGQVPEEKGENVMQKENGQ